MICCVKGKEEWDYLCQLNWIGIYRFDSIKYDVKKIEEVVYDITLRGLHNPNKRVSSSDAKENEELKKTKVEEAE